MKKLLLALLFVPQVALAEGSIGPKNVCVQAANTSNSTSLINSTMASSRTFNINRPNLGGGFNILRLFFALVDANTSITRFDLTCTVSDDGGTTDFKPQECTVAAGVATCVDSGVWQKASPGTANWSYRLDISGWPDIECTASVGAGSGAAADTIVVTGMYCTE